MPFDCPRCGGKVKITNIEYSTRFFVICENCGLSYLLDAGVRDRLVAYYLFLDAYDVGLAKDIKELKSELISSGLLRDPSEIVDMVKRYGLNLEDLPDVVRDILFSEKDYIALYRLFEATDAEYGCTVDNLNVHDGLKEALKSAGITRLYKFQEEAIKKILDGKDIVIVAPTGNGKTEAFAVPIMHLIASEKGVSFYPLVTHMKRGVKALFIYPTKSLSRDQLLKLKRMGSYVGVTVEVFDGDTSTSEREKIYSDPPDILITNFDILHYHLSHRTELTYHLKSVKYVVVDELHEYTGAFGSNVYFILKRLQRLCGKVQLIGSSATIANPKEFAEALFDRDVEVVECKRGKRGRMHFIMLYPSLRTHHAAISDIVSKLVKSGFKTLVFSNSHSEAEIIKQILDRSGIRCHVHRAGLRKEFRRRIEAEFRRGGLMVISATSTLELGIDIGDLDAVITLPIGLSRFLQRAGRAGRRGQEAVSVLVLRNGDPISAYYKKNPEKYFAYLEPIYVEPRNPVVAKYQLIAASLDEPLKLDDFREYKDILDDLVKEKILYIKDNIYYPRPIARKIVKRYNIRGIGDIVRIYLGDKVIGERELPMALRELFPGAVYLHGGYKYQSKSLKIIRSGLGVSQVEPLPKDYQYKTDAIRYAQPEVLDILERKIVYGVEVLYCKLRIKEVVEGYILKNIYSGEVEGRYSLDEPLEYSFETLGFVFKAPDPGDVIYEFEVEEIEAIAGTYHAVEHILIESSDIFTGSGAREVGGVSMGLSGTIFVYDGCPGGSGATLLLFRKLDEAFKRAYEIVKTCDCNRVDGCPNCTYSYQCGNNNRPLFRPGAVESLYKILKGVETRVIEEEYIGEKPYIAGPTISYIIL